MDNQSSEDVKTLIGNEVLQIPALEHKHEEIKEGFLISNQSFQAKGIKIAIISTGIITLFIFTIFFILSAYNRSSVSSSPYSTFVSYLSPNERRQNSSLSTSYILPQYVPLLELHAKRFNFNAECPDIPFALVAHLERDSVSNLEQWLSRCGKFARYLRLNSNTLEDEDVNRLVPYVPNAQYIPVMAEYHGVQGSEDILSNSVLNNEVDRENKVITSLKLSGYVTIKDVTTLMELMPYIEHLELEGAGLCSSILRPPKLNQSTCKISWDVLTSLKLQFGEECLRTLQYIDMCWNTPSLSRLEVGEMRLNDYNAKYIEDIIDQNRITDANFHNNLCSDDVLKRSSYMCWMDEGL